MKSILSILMITSLLCGQRVKELTQIEGIRDNQLVGYGVVVGLNGTGDKRQTLFSAQSLASLLQRFQVNVPPNGIQVKNTASVMLTATLPPFVKPGQKLDVSVAAIGDATSLRGGLLIMAPLRAANGQVYCAAQGSILVGGFTAGGGGNSQVVNHPTAGRIPGSCLVEQAAPSVMPDKDVHLSLKQADFGTAAAIAAAVNQRFQQSDLARAVSSGEIVVSIPEKFRTQPAEFLAIIESLEAQQERRNRIVINERTGTIAIGASVRIRPTSVLHGGLTIQIRTEFDVSQPNGFSKGSTEVVPRVNVDVKEDKARAINMAEGATVSDLVKALQAIGAAPRDIVAILESLRAASAFDADLEVI
jgi:flagellar P-ring protein FlgI